MRLSIFLFFSAIYLLNPCVALAASTERVGYGDNFYSIAFDKIEFDMPRDEVKKIIGRQCTWDDNDHAIASCTVSGKKTKVYFYFSHDRLVQIAYVLASGRMEEIALDNSLLEKAQKAYGPKLYPNSTSATHEVDNSFYFILAKFPLYFNDGEIRSIFVEKKTYDFMQNTAKELHQIIKNTNSSAYISHNLFWGTPALPYIINKHDSYLYGQVSLTVTVKQNFTDDKEIYKEACAYIVAAKKLFDQKNLDYNKKIHFNFYNKTQGVSGKEVTKSLGFFEYHPKEDHVSWKHEGVWKVPNP